MCGARLCVMLDGVPLRLLIVDDSA